MDNGDQKQRWMTTTAKFLAVVMVFLVIYVAGGLIVTLAYLRYATVGKPVGTEIEELLH